MLAKLYKEGTGVGQDNQRAKEYLEKAVQLEEPSGLFLLGKAL